MTCWMAWSATCPSLKFRAASSVIRDAQNTYRQKLEMLPEECLPHGMLVQRKYMKEKHWIYAILMAAMETLPLTYKECTRVDILNAVLAKAYLGASSKLLDNLNDEIHTVQEALDSLENYLCALTCGEYRRKGSSPVQMAESSACEMASWIYQSLNHDAPAFKLYLKDCTTLVEGQISSLEHKSTEWPSLADYVDYISEKSIGDVWIDIDLCQFDDLNEDLLSLKKSNEYIFKSSLVYDDVQDIYEDIQTKSVNSALIRALEREIISEEDLDTKEPAELVEILEREGVLEDIIWLADAFFLKGISAFMEMETSSVDKEGLLSSFRLVRLFNLRKLLMRNKDMETLKRVLQSFSDFHSLREQIPEGIGALVW